MTSQRLVRPLSELVDANDPGWPAVERWIANGAGPIEVLPVDRGRAESVLHALQVTTHSPIGAVAYETGGILVDDGWVRILGSGSTILPATLTSWNGIGDDPTWERMDGLLIVALDAVGGVFALNNGAFGGKATNAYYFAPDSLAWEDLGGGYGMMLEFLLSSARDEFYEPMRWDGWREDVKTLSGDQAFSLWPPPWTDEGTNPSSSSRKAVKLTELVRLELRYAEEFRAKNDAEGDAG